MQWGNALKFLSRVSVYPQYLKKGGLIVFWLLKDWICSPKLRIHFSTSHWEDSIRRYLRWTKHEIVFDDLKRIDSQSVDLVVPLGMADMEFVAQNRDEFGNYLLPIPNQETIGLLNDKGKFSDWLLNSKYKKHALQEKRDLPFFLKPVTGAWGEGCHAVTSQADFDKHKQLIQSDDFICQELVYGDTEYATHFMLNNGEVLNHLCIEYRFDSDTPVKGVGNIVSKVIARDKFLPEWKSMLLDIKYSGICCLNYKVSDGVPKLMEINPRFGGSLAEFFFSFIYAISRHAKSKNANHGDTSEHVL